jgi:hypothetical protein
MIDSRAAANLVVTLRQDQMNAADVDCQRRGYYEELDMVRANYRLWGNEVEKPDEWVDQGLFRPRNDFLRQEMTPSKSGILCGTPATTNRWGMRDRDYNKEKTAGIYRFVLLGSSHEVGSGVKDDETFENLVENRLNQALASQKSTQCEILNLSVGGYGVLRKLGRLERDGFGFAPDAVIFSVNAGDRVFDLDDMVRMLATDAELPYSYLSEIFKQARVDQLDYRLGGLVILHRLQPYIPDVYRMSFRRLRDQCAARNIRAVVLYRPSAVDSAQFEPSRRKEILDLANEAGLDIIDLSFAFDQIEDRASLVLAPWDDHTNALGHKLLADILYTELSKRFFRDQLKTNTEDNLIVR